MRLMKDTTFWTESQCFISNEFVSRKAIMKFYYINITWSQARFLIAPSGSFFTHIKANLKPKSHISKVKASKLGLIYKDYMRLIGINLTAENWPHILKYLLILFYTKSTNKRISRRENIHIKSDAMKDRISNQKYKRI